MLTSFFQKPLSIPIKIAEVGFYENKNAQFVATMMFNIIIHFQETMRVWF